MVTREVSDYALVMGSPARQVGWVCACNQRLEFDEDGKGCCEACGNRYQLVDEQVELLT